MKWNFSKCAKAGSRHIEAGIPCQDMVYAFKRGNFHAAALSDGAGSAKFAHIGANETVHFICKWLEHNFDSLFPHDTAETFYDPEVIKKNFAIKMKTDLQQYLQKTAADRNIPLEEMACTVLFVAVKDDNYIAGHVGDGFIAALTGNSPLPEVISYPHNGIFSNITFFVTEEDMDIQLELKTGSISGENIKSFALMSDGTADGAWNPAKNSFFSSFPEFMEYVSSHPKLAEQEMRRLLDKISEVSTSDDCSLLIMACAGKENE